MKLYVLTRYRVAVLGIIIILGLVLRLHNYTQWPREGATFDEYAWPWLGMSIINTGVPTSWSPHKAYTTRTLFHNSKGATFFLVTPYLEHPPLFGLVAGSYARMVGMKDFSDVTPDKIRPLGILLGILSIVGVYLVSREVSDIQTGLQAAFLYTIMPSASIGSRLVQNENFFIPMFLFSLYFAINYLKSEKSFALLGSILLASVLPLAKIPWMAAPATIFALFISKRKYRESMLLVLATVGFFSIFVLYGYRLDSQLFISLWKLQLARYDMTFETIFSILRDPIITDRLFLDGFIYLGFITLGIVASIKKSEYLPVLLGFLSYFFVYLFAIPNEPGHGWYRFPLYPFFIISIALAMKEYFNKNMILSWFIIIIPGMAALTMTWQQQFGFSYALYRGFLLSSAVGLTTLVFPQQWLFRFGKITNVILLCCVYGIVIWSGMSYTEQ